CVSSLVCAFQLSRIGLLDVIRRTHCVPLFFFLLIRRPPRSTLFPTRRSSDLSIAAGPGGGRNCGGHAHAAIDFNNADGRTDLEVDRKSTRLNSSHVKISYAVFCLKKKTTPNETSNCY